MQQTEQQTLLQTTSNKHPRIKKIYNSTGKRNVLFCIYSDKEHL